MGQATVLVVDDDALQRTILRDILEAEGYEVIAAASAQAALEVLGTRRPDVLLVDVMMPGMDGFDLCRRLKGQAATRLIPRVLLTSLQATEDRVHGFEAGADEFISKPVHEAELAARVQMLVRLKRYTDQLDHPEAVLFSLARGVEGRDPNLEGHCERVAHYATALGTALGLAADGLEALRRAAVLHDIGKIGVPDAILFKPGPLTRDEWRVMREHPVIGERICQPLMSLQDVLPIIRHHHERWDGTGYPDGLAGEAIPLPARILQVADIFDSLTTARPYHPPKAPARALEILRGEVAKGLREARLVTMFQWLWETGALQADGALALRASLLPGSASPEGALRGHGDDGASLALLEEVSCPS